MDNRVAFRFMDKARRCDMYIDIAADPCFIFIVLLDNELIDLFGEDVTIETDFEQLLKMEDHHEHLTALKRALFDCARQLTDFRSAKERLFRYENRKYKI